MNFAMQSVMIPKYFGDTRFDNYMTRLSEVLGGNNYLYNYVIADMQGYMNCISSTEETLRILKATTNPDLYHVYRSCGDFEQQFRVFSSEFTYCVDALKRFFSSSIPFTEYLKFLQIHGSYLDIGHVDTGDCFIMASLTL